MFVKKILYSYDATTFRSYLHSLPKRRRDAQAKEAVLFHLETLNPEFTPKGTTLTVKVIPLDPQLFLPDEACDIIRQTLAQSLTFNHCWTCTLQTIN